MVRTTYPVLPVMAIMGLGYIVGKWYTHFDSDKRKKYLLNTSLVMVSSFVFFRIIIGYGDSSPIDTNNGIQSYIISVMNTTKYPMSLDFILIYLSIPICILSLTDNKNFIGFTVTLGRVPMFFYVLHIYILHLLILIWLIIHGEYIDLYKNLGGVPSDTGYPIEILLFIVPATIAILYIPCKWYYNIKRKKQYTITNYL